MSMPLVIIESPYAGDIPRNALYLGRALRDCIGKGEAPIASHGLFPRYYSDALPAERQLCMEAGWAWMRAADKIAVYTDYGLTDGMRRGIEEAERLRRHIVYRQIGVNP